MMLLDTSHHVPLANLHEFTGGAGKNSTKTDMACGFK